MEPGLWVWHSGRYGQEDTWFKLRHRVEKSRFTIIGFSLIGLALALVGTVFLKAEKRVGSGD
jgi:hypothetical protein